MMFDICKNEDGKASVAVFLEEVQKCGIRKTDPRLENMMKMLHKLKPHTLSSVEDLKLDVQTFTTVMRENVVLITKALHNHMIIPAFDVFCDDITKIYEKFKFDTTGTAAPYIPHMRTLGAEKWGLSICTVDGQRFSLGNYDEFFTIQSTCTPVTYAITLNELGEELVHKYQGRKPSGRMFNEIVLDDNNKPHNPLVNSGAIMSAALILELVKPELEDMAAKFEFVHNYFKEMAGMEEVKFNNSVFLTERSSADRNFALAYFMRENKCFPPGVDIKKILDFHFQLCSLEMTCESSSVMAATLAKGGVCPITGQRVLASEAVQNVLALMYSCGMYNYSGQFAFEVGLPAKSGGGGTLMLVIPNVMGITLWSPCLDNLGNSVRGVQFCKELIKTYHFHRFDGVGKPLSHNTKVDPMFKKYETASEVVIQLLLAAASGDNRSIQRAWLQDVDLNVGDYDGRTALHLSAAEGHLESVKFLLETCQVNPDPMDRWNRTPLSEAIEFEHVRVAQLLRQHIDNRPTGGLISSFDDFDMDENDMDDEENRTDTTDKDCLTDAIDIPNSSQTGERAAFSDDSSPSVPQICVEGYNGTFSPQPLSIATRGLLDPNYIPDVVGPSFPQERRRSLSFLSSFRQVRVNTRSPRMSPRGSPTLPRAQFDIPDSVGKF
ncbi:glutaminase liver isoform, mitochondrial-like isoform X2 [Tigriopus californicus]|nr:glutaminase liver isoform, mitochondrial-like isoform X2 [Tigriopus californicus]